VIILYLFSVLWQEDVKGRFKQAIKARWVYPFLLLFFIHAISLIWSEDFQTGWFVVEKKASLLAVPMLIAMDSHVNRNLLHHALFSLIIGCFTALWICLGYSLWQFVRVEDPALFFYHNFSWPLDEFNATYLSLYTFISLVSLNYLSGSVEYSPLHRPWIRGLLIATFLGGILLLSSKLFIVLTACYLVFLLIRQLRERMHFNQAVFVWSLGLTALLGGVLLPGYIWKRFDQIMRSQFEVIHQDQFQWDSPFNGLTLRMLFLRFGWGILAENKALISGVGVGDAQEKINGMIRRHNLYHGNPSLGNTGYLGYNFHNQYMEFWVQTGLLGLLSWIWVIVHGWQKGIFIGWHSPLVYLAIAIALFAFSEGFMERQRGIVFTVYFLSIFHSTVRK